MRVDICSFEGARIPLAWNREGSADQATIDLTALMWIEVNLDDDR